MADFILSSGDQITIRAPIQDVLIPVPLIFPLQGSGSSVHVNGKPICVEGDEIPEPLKQVFPYTAPPFVIPGQGKLRITLTPGHWTKATKHNGKAILLKGGDFTVIFEVTVPAQQPAAPTPIPEVPRPRTGSGSYITLNTTVKAD